MLTMISPAFTSTMRSPVTARPTDAPTLSTPSMSRIVELSSVAISVILTFDVPLGLASRTSTA